MLLPIVLLGSCDPGGKDGQSAGQPAGDPSGQPAGHTVERGELALTVVSLPGSDQAMKVVLGLGGRSTISCTVDGTTETMGLDEEESLAMANLVDAMAAEMDGVYVDLGVLDGYLHHCTFVTGGGEGGFSCLNGAPVAYVEFLRVLNGHLGSDVIAAEVKAFEAGSFSRYTDHDEYFRMMREGDG